MKHSILYWDETRYSSFPHGVKGENDELWGHLAWNAPTPLARGPEGAAHSHGGASVGGKHGHVDLFSPDGGESWFEDGKSNLYRECPEALRSAVLKDGSQIRISRPSDIIPAVRKEEFSKRGFVLRKLPGARFSVENRLQMFRKRAASERWESRYLNSGKELPLFALIRTGTDLNSCILPDDTILHEVYGSVSAGDPFRAWVLRSEDAGDTWEMVEMAFDGGVHPFNEASLLHLKDGRIFAMVRTSSSSKSIPIEEKYLWQTHSSDQGKTWSPVQKTPMWGYPAQLLLLRNGDVLCSYGHRRSPYGIRACLSRDGCETWDIDHEIVLRADGLTPDGILSGKGGSPDLGSPKTVELNDGTLFTVYYFTLGDSVTHVAATKWSL